MRQESPALRWMVRESALISLVRAFRIWGLRSGRRSKRELRLAAVNNLPGLPRMA